MTVPAAIIWAALILVCAPLILAAGAIVIIGVLGLLFALACLVLTCFEWATGRLS